MDQPELRGPLDIPPSSSGAPARRDFPAQTAVVPPLDLSALGLRSIVARRVIFPRRPPEMALTWAAAEPSSASPNPDVAFVCSLPTPELAFRLASLAARIETQVQ